MADAFASWASWWKTVRNNHKCEFVAGGFRPEVAIRKRRRNHGRFKPICPVRLSFLVVNMHALGEDVHWTYGRY